MVALTGLSELIASSGWLDESQCGCPGSIAVSIWVKPREYMNDWNCSAPSIRQIRPRTLWIARRLLEAK
jgi:hypothetical protein